MTNEEKIIQLRIALQAQEDYGAMSRQRQAGEFISPIDPRYTPVIGEWNGYHAPELRFDNFAHVRHDLRRAALLDTE